MGRNRYTIVVSSCDKYEDLWEPFFTVLKGEWDGLDKIPIVLNTESKSYSHEGLDIRTFKLYPDGKDNSWTERLRRTLELINTEYILFLLDDFFMQQKVRAEKIDEHIKWLDSNPDVSMFCYKETLFSKNIRDGRFEGFERRPVIGQYKFNCQAALWRRKRLITYLKVDENPWEWEVYGNWRSYRHPFHRFYSTIPGVEHVFPYIYDIKEKPIGGIGIYRGRWYLPYVKPIFDKYGIKVDYSIRGIITEEDIESSKKDAKKKDGAPAWKQCLWFARPVYCRIKNAWHETMHVMKNIKHFL